MNIFGFELTITPKKKKDKSVISKKKISKQLQIEKDEATAKNEPWVTIVSMDIDPEDLSSGFFEFDWNDKFLATLIRAGYSGKTDVEVVNSWFTELCGGVYAETFEQDMADPDKRKTFQKTQLDNDRTIYE
jgi:hypothetical protein